MHSCLLCLKQSQDFSLQVFLIKLNMIFYTTSQAKQKTKKLLFLEMRLTKNSLPGRLQFFLMDLIF